MSTGTIAFGDFRYKVSDLSAARNFYSRCFGVKPYFDEPTWVVFEIHNYQLWLEPDNLIESIYETTNPFYELSKDRKLTYWAVENVEEICNRFRDLGGVILKVPKKDGPFTDALVKDPWNNELGLHSNSLF
jgi:lactoylglutathione lyase